MKQSAAICASPRAASKSRQSKETGYFYECTQPHCNQFLLGQPLDAPPSATAVTTHVQVETEPITHDMDTLEKRASVRLLLLLLFTMWLNLVTVDSSPCYSSSLFVYGRAYRTSLDDKHQRSRSAKPTGPTWMRPLPYHRHALCFDRTPFLYLTLSSQIILVLPHEN